MEGKYALLREIGRGAMGEVFLAEDRVLERKVALKFLTLPQGLDKAERQEAVARFYREAQAAAKLAHPNIVVIYDIDELEGRHFISMEYLEGETLDEVMARGPLPPERATEIVSQILSALSYAHSQGVIHRDIKPENIFLSAAGTVKVTDFGIARVMGSSTMTQAGTVMGTPGYMSPEQVKGEKVDARTDIFSAGVILYELLTGSRAFAADSLTAVMYRIVNEDPPPLMQVDPSLPAWLQRVVARATAKDPGLRYPDASAMISDLAARGEAPLPSPSPSSPPTVMLAQEEVKEEAPGTVLRPPTAPLPVPEGMSLSPAPSRRKAYLIAVVSSLAALLVVGGAVLALLLLTSSKVTVPDLEGLDLEEAEELISRAGLELEVEAEVPRSDAEEGEVLSQTPAAGQKLEKGSVVRVDVCGGGGKSGTESISGYGLDDQRIGTKVENLMIVDVRHANHGTYYRVVFELASMDGTPAPGCPITTASWQDGFGGIEVDISGIRGIFDPPNAGESEGVRDDLVLSISNVTAEGNQVVEYLIKLARKAEYHLFKVENPIRIVIDISKG